MRLQNKQRVVAVLAAVASLGAPMAHAALISNGGFEAGLAGWSSTDQIGSDGTFAVQSGTASPVNGDPVPAPPEGVNAAMTDAQGPGSHAISQNFVVTAPMPTATLSFDLFIGNRAGTFFTPNSLDFATTALNQQARVDILGGGADALSMAPADVLLNLFRTNVGDPAVSGYTHVSVDVTAFVNSHLNTPLKLRFAETDNVFTFQFGVDNVSLVPEPTAALLGVAGAAMALRRRDIRGLVV